MNEVERIKAWMSTNGLTISQLASEIRIPYINAYMCIEKRGRISANFELAFRRRFGAEVADRIFDAPVGTKEIARP